MAMVLMLSVTPVVEFDCCTPFLCAIATIPFGVTTGMVSYDFVSAHSMSSTGTSESSRLLAGCSKNLADKLHRSVVLASYPSTEHGTLQPRMFVSFGLLTSISDHGWCPVFSL